MKNLMLIVIYLLLTSTLSSQANANRGLPYGADSWVMQTSYTCETTGYTIAILRKGDYEEGNSPYKIELSYHSISSEYCDKTRRDVLANWYGGSNEFSSVKLTNNAKWGDYCNSQNQWIIGTAYNVTYPNPNNSGGPFTTNIYHDANIHLNIGDIQDAILMLNSKSNSFSAPPCPSSKCGKWGDTGGIKDDSNDRGLGSKEMKAKVDNLLKKDIRYIDPQPKGNKGNTSGTLKPNGANKKSAASKARKNGV